jgi:hypothetical protein
MQASEKSTYMRMLERHHGKPIEEIVAQAVREYETREAQAAFLGVSATTLAKWKALFRAAGVIDREEVAA